MYKRKTKPDLMFLLTVFVCLGVLVTSTVSADEPPRQDWAMTINATSDCQQSSSEWQACAGWQGLTGDKSHGQGATVRFFHQQRPELGVIWYYSHEPNFKPYNISELDVSDKQQDFIVSGPTNAQFGVALRQQYRHFGFSVGIESEQIQTLNNEAVVYFGISNRW